MKKVVGIISEDYGQEYRKIKHICAYRAFGVNFRMRYWPNIVFSGYIWPFFSQSDCQNVVYSGLAL